MAATVGEKSWLIPCLIGAGVAVSAGALAAGALWWYKRRQRVASAVTVKEMQLDEFNIPVARVDKLCVYPLKSTHRVEVESTECLIRGFKYDRCWVIMDKENQFVSMRTMPQLARIQSSVREEEDGTVTLVLSAPNMETIAVPQPSEDQPAYQARVWRITGEGFDVGDIAAEWISKFLESEGCRILYMSSSNKPRVLSTDPKGYDCKPEDETSFADFSPVFIASEGSLEEVNSKLQSPVPMTRFRPNIVVSGCLPYAEDNWTEVKIGKECVLRKVKHGSRCKMTTIDQERGERVGREPLETLATYRMHEDVFDKVDGRYSSPLFGSHFAVVKPGQISVGDSVCIMSQ